MADRNIEQIIIHCSASPFGSRKLIYKWHVDGNGWDDVGYHYVIPNGRPVTAKEYDPAWDGILETGRRIDVQGAHVAGHNAYSLGICLIGEASGLFTPRQMDTLGRLVDTLQSAYRVPSINVLGHRDLDSSKECPGFDVQDWMETRRQAA